MIILEIILVFLGLAFIILMCIAVYKVRTNLPIKNGQIGPNSIQDIGEQINAVIIDKDGNKIHIN